MAAAGLPQAGSSDRCSSLFLLPGFGKMADGNPPLQRQRSGLFASEFLPERVFFWNRGYTQPMRTKTSVSQEDYLKAIWELLEEGQPPISARLAEELSVTPPAVTAALKRLRRDDLVSVARNGHIDLTRKGRAVAEHMALRHQLAEMLLTDVIGIPWSKAHDEAERLEHAISPEIEALLLKRFADKKSCPHGLPLRGGVTQLRKQGAALLSDLQANERAEIVCVYEKDGKFLEFLDNLHLHPGSQLSVTRREYDETLTLRSSNRTLHLGKPATSRIWVRRLQ
jgi:DtxR family Mn-dependent transcriptional regulator